MYIIPQVGFGLLYVFKSVLGVRIGSEKREHNTTQ